MDPLISSVTIANLPVGSGQPVFIVAEAGVNHNGCLETAMALVNAAALAGADAVKFQLFRATSLVTPQAATASYQRQGTNTRLQQEMLSTLELSLDEMAALKQECHQRNLIFMATPFGPVEVAQLAGLGSAAVKIASTDLNNPPLIQAAVATNLPIVLSTGASTLDEIDQAVSSLHQGGAEERLILLHCVSCYPTDLEAINLGAIGKLSTRYDLPTGLSDHTLSTDTGGWAVAAGACLVEKHLTLDTRQDGPDHAISLTPDQFAVYVSLIRQAELAMGDGAIGMTPSQEEVRRIASKSVVSAMDIPEGVLLTSDHLTLKRPGNGLSSNELEELLGRRTTVNIKSDTLLAWDMVL